MSHEFWYLDWIDHSYWTRKGITIARKLNLNFGLWSANKDVKLTLANGMLGSILKLFSLDSRCLLQSKTAPLILINLGFHTFTGVMFTNLGQTRIGTVMHRVSLVKSLREATYERRQSNKKKLSRSRLQQLAGEDYRVNAGFVAKVVPELDSVIISQPAETSWIRLARRLDHRLDRSLDRDLRLLKYLQLWPFMSYN